MKIYIAVFVKKGMLEKRKNRGQVSIFIIVGIVIVGAILAYFLVRGYYGAENIPAEFKPIYDYYSGCIMEKAQEAIDLAGTQGGRVYVDSYIPGSQYAPFSNQLNFLGFPVPYWYYVAGNGLIKEQVPKKSNIEDEIGRYVEEHINECDLERFYEQGYFINLGTPKADVTINDGSVDVNLNQEISASKDEGSARKSSYSVSVASKLGKFYSVALNLYNRQAKDAFLENYTIDVLNLYAPVSGVAIQCSPKIWNTREVVDDLQNALEANIASIKFDGNYYVLANKESKYFVVKEGVDEQVNLLYSKSWPTKVEVYGEGAGKDLLTAGIVGTQNGLGALGFCYSPYHFVYDLSFPVMFQITDGTELFQFPVAVIVDKNVPRKAVLNEVAEEPEVDLCQYYDQDIKVGVYDANLNPVDADLSFECFSQKCSLGKTKGGEFSGKSPTCANGYIVAKAEGYKEGKQLFSTNEESLTDIILDKEYSVNVVLNMDGKEVKDNAFIGFTKDDGETISAVVPGYTKIALTEGNYKVKVYIYGNSSLSIPASTKRECQQVSQTGFLGFFGLTEEKCFDIKIPETNIDYALMGGGVGDEYLLASELAKGNMQIDVSSFRTPSSLEQLQYNFESFDSQSISVVLK